MSDYADNRRILLVEDNLGDAGLIEDMLDVPNAAPNGLEHVETRGFGWIKGDVQVIEPKDGALKIPHMGWNTLDSARPHALFSGIALGETGLHAYFVHSYHLALRDPSALIATADYGGAVTAFVGRDNMVGSQFHPEKSQALGLALIGNFLKWRP